MNRTGEDMPEDQREPLAATIRCPSCGFDLRGLPEDHRCPECGFGYSAEAIRALVVEEAGRRVTIYRFAVEICAWAVAIVVATVATRWLGERYGVNRAAPIGIVMFLGVWRLISTIPFDEMWRIPIYLTGVATLVALAVFTPGFLDLMLVGTAMVAVGRIVVQRPLYPHLDSSLTHEMELVVRGWSVAAGCAVGIVAILLLVRAMS